MSNVFSDTFAWLADVFIEHGDPAKLLALQGLDAAGIRASIAARFLPGSAG